MRLSALAILCMLLSACSLLCQGSDIPINAKSSDCSKERELVYATLAKSVKIIQKKYGLRPAGLGSAMPGGPIRELVLAFEVKGPLSKDELRRLLILSAREVVNLVTNNQEMQQYLYDPPFTIKNVQIIVYNSDKSNREVLDPLISVAELSDGVIIFRTTDPKNTHRYKERMQESYEEALQLSGLEP